MPKRFPAVHSKQFSCQSKSSRASRPRSRICDSMIRITSWVQAWAICFDPTNINAWFAWDYVSLEWGAWNRSISVCNIYVVWAWHRRDVRDLTSSILVVLALDGRLGRALHRQSKPTWTLFLSGINSEYCRLVRFPALQARTIGFHLRSALDSIHMEWRMGHRLSSIGNLHLVRAWFQKGKGCFGSIPCWGGWHIQDLVGRRNNLHLGLCLGQATGDNTNLSWFSNWLGYTKLR